MATTTNYGWTTPDDTALVKDGAAAIRTLGSSVDTTTKNLNPETTLGDIAYRSSTANVNTRLPLGTAGQVLKVNSGATAPEWSSDNAGMTNPMTTTGDTIYSSSGSTPARLAIGSTGNVLTVAGGVPTWAAPAAGGMTLLSTSSLAGVISLTISSINQTYTNLMIVVANLSCNNLRPEVQLVSANTCFYVASVADTTTTAVQNFQGADIKLSPNVNMLNLNPYNNWTINITRYASGDNFKSFQYFGGGNNLTQKTKIIGGGIYDGIPGINSISIISTSGNTFSAGDVFIYGVK